MSIEITDPQLLDFLNEQVRLGRFDNLNEAVAAGVASLMRGPMPAPLDEATLDAIESAEEQLERGEAIDWEAAKQTLRAKMLARGGAARPA